MFWHTARDDTMFTYMRCISRHEGTQVYSSILLKELTNQAMLESKAYKTYYAFAYGEKTPKPNADEGTGTIPGVLDVPIYESESEKEYWGDSGEEDEDDENDSVDKSDSNDDDDGGGDTKMTNADQGGSGQQNVSQESGFKQVEEDAYVALTSVLETQKTDEPVQSSSVSSEFTSKLLNLENPSPVDNEIASLMETSARH
nr:hypothetical protein [Tanacetum cinerariifolium]